MIAYLVGLRTGRAAAACLLGRFAQTFVLGHWIVFHDLALEDPHLHAARAVGGLCGRYAVIDIGSQRMQRHTPLAVPLHARDFRAAEPSGAVDADALSAEPHGGLHRALHGAAEGHAALELLGDVVGDELGVDFRLPDLDDVEMDLGVRVAREIRLQLFDVGALLADHNARTRGMNRDAALFVRPFDHDARYAGLFQLVLQVIADLDVLLQELAILLFARVPARIPGAIDAEPKPDRIDLLTHQAFSLVLVWTRRLAGAAGFFAAGPDFGFAVPDGFGASAFAAGAFSSRFSSTTIVTCANGFSMRAPRPRARAWKRFITRLRPTEASVTTRSSTSRSWLFSALAMADSRTFLTSRAMRLGEKVSVASAFSADCPRIDRATRLSLRGLTRIFRPMARACVSMSERLRAGLPTFFRSLFFAGLGDFGFAVARVSVENPRRGELTEFVTDHVFGHHHRYVLLAVVDAEGQPDELRQNRRTPRPDLDHFLAARIARNLRLLEHVAVDKRTFPN